MSCFSFLQILDEIQKHDIQIYEFPECDSDEDEDFKKQDQELKVCLYLLTPPPYTYVKVRWPSHKQEGSENYYLAPLAFYLLSA